MKTKDTQGTSKARQKRHPVTTVPFGVAQKGNELQDKLPVQMEGEEEEMIKDDREEW